MTVPAIAAIEIPWGGAVGGAVGPELELDEVDEGEGAAGVEDGD